MSSWKIFEDINLYFTTYTITDWYPIFTKPRYFNLIINSLKYCMNEKGLKIHAYVIMLNHIHLIISREDDSQNSINDIFRDHKRHTSKGITELLVMEKLKVPLSIFKKRATIEGKGNDYKVWQQGFHPKAIYDEKFCLQKMNYIHWNPVKKGYVQKPEHWYYSSAGYYAGLGEGALEVEPIFNFDTLGGSKTPF